VLVTVVPMTATAKDSNQDFDRCGYFPSSSPPPSLPLPLTPSLTVLLQFSLDRPLRGAGEVLPVLTLPTALLQPPLVPLPLPSPPPPLPSLPPVSFLPHNLEQQQSQRQVVLASFTPTDPVASGDSSSNSNHGCATMGYGAQKVDAQSQSQSPSEPPSEPQVLSRILQLSEATHATCVRRIRCLHPAPPPPLVSPPVPAPAPAPSSTLQPSELPEVFTGSVANEQGGGCGFINGAGGDGDGDDDGDGDAEADVGDAAYALESPGFLGIAGKVWDSMYVLLQYLSQHQEALITGKRIIELGCGTGLAGAQYFSFEFLGFVSGDCCSNIILCVVLVLLRALLLPCAL
jgi:hypothetical protein